MIKKVTNIFLIPIFLMMPAVTLAATTTVGLHRLIDQIQGLVQRLIPVIIGIALLLFLWGILRFLISQDDGKREEAKKFMIWGIVALFVMVAVWGLVEIFAETFLVSGNVNTGDPDFPKIPGTSISS